MPRTTLSVMSLACPAARRGYATQSIPDGKIRRAPRELVGSSKEGDDDVGRLVPSDGNQAGRSVGELPARQGAIEPPARAGRKTKFPRLWMRWRS